MQNISPINIEEIYLAGGCLWGVQEFIRYLPGVVQTEAGRANGSSNKLIGSYDGYAECVKTHFDPSSVSVEQLVQYFFEIIDPKSLNQQGPDIGEKYRTGVYSKDPEHLSAARDFIAMQPNAASIVVEVCPLINYLRSDNKHQDRLTRRPADACHLPSELLHKYKH